MADDSQITLDADSVVNPIDTPEAFYTCQVGGVQMPGVIGPDGFSGWELKSTYQVKKGKGVDGATITDTGDDLPTGKIKTQLWRNGVDGEGQDDPNVPNDFDEDADFVRMLRAARRAKHALDIVHPIVNGQEVTSVVCTSIGALTYVGSGLWTREFEFLKWVPQPKAAGGTPAGSQDKDSNKPDNDSGTKTPDPLDAEKQELQDKIKEAQQPDD